MCVWFLACLSVCLCALLSMTEGEGELCTLLPLCVYCLLNGVLTCHHTPHWEAPSVLDWVPRVHRTLFVFIEHEVNSLILWPTKGFECYIKSIFRCLRPKYWSLNQNLLLKVFRHNNPDLWIDCATGIHNNKVRQLHRACKHQKLETLFILQLHLHTRLISCFSETPMWFVLWS